MNMRIQPDSTAQDRWPQCSGIHRAKRPDHHVVLDKHPAKLGNRTRGPVRPRGPAKPRSSNHAPRTNGHATSQHDARGKHNVLGKCGPVPQFGRRRQNRSIVQELGEHPGGKGVEPHVGEVADTRSQGAVDQQTRPAPMGLTCCGLETGSKQRCQVPLCGFGDRREPAQVAVQSSQVPTKATDQGQEREWTQRNHTRAWEQAGAQEAQEAQEPHFPKPQVAQRRRR